MYSPHRKSIELIIYHFPSPKSISMEQNSVMLLQEEIDKRLFSLAQVAQLFENEMILKRMVTML